MIGVAFSRGEVSMRIDTLDRIGATDLGKPIRGYILKRW